MQDEETALQQAQRVGVEAASVGFDWEHAADALDKVAEEARKDERKKDEQEQGKCN